MPKDASTLSLDAGQLVAAAFALIPIPIAVIDEEGKVVLANSCFSDTFPDTNNISEQRMHELVVPGRGTFDLETLPLNDNGLRMVYGADVSKEICLRRQLSQIESTEPRKLRPCAARVPCDLNDIARAVMRARESFIRSAKIGIGLSLDPQLPLVDVDPEGIAKLLTTLAINAEQAIVFEGRRNGAIQIKTWLQRGKVRLSIGDNGAGMMSRRLAAFERGEQSITQETAVHPTSMGWCAEMIKDYGGELFCWSSYAVGSTYTLELPAISATVNPQQQQGS